MNAREIFDCYLDELTLDPSAWTSYTANALWTPTATRALVATGLRAYPEGEATAKGHRDRYGRSEYLTLDACVCPPSWGAPLFVAEHENAGRTDKVQYCAWKLLVTEARRRVLVAYFGAGTDLADFAALRAKVEEVAKDNPGHETSIKDILLIGGRWGASPSSNADLRGLHESAIIGFLGDSSRR